MWGLPEHLLAAIADRLASIIWQNGGGKGAKPKPITRPGLGPTKSKVASREFDAMTIEDYERRYAERKSQQRGG